MRSRAPANGKYPALVDGDLVLYESFAITQYLGAPAVRRFDSAPCACARRASFAQPAPLLRAASKYGEGTGLAPEGVEEVALTNQWSLWSLTECEGPILSLMSKGAMGAPADQAEAAEALVRPLTALEESLQDSEYLVGGRFTVADLNVSSIVGTWGVRGAKRKAAAWPANLSAFSQV